MSTPDYIVGYSILYFKKILVLSVVRDREEHGKNQPGES
jgi:hypothetical protein